MAVEEGRRRRRTGAGRPRWATLGGEGEGRREATSRRKFGELGTYTNKKKGTGTKPPTLNTRVHEHWTGDVVSVANRRIGPLS